MKKLQTFANIRVYNISDIYLHYISYHFSCILHTISTVILFQIKCTHVSLTKSLLVVKISVSASAFRRPLYTVKDPDLHLALETQNDTDSAARYFYRY